MNRDGRNGIARFRLSFASFSFSVIDL